jgi:serine/threonine protein kinase
VTYELLTGRPPYLFDALADLARQQGGGLITPVRDLEPTVPEPVEAVVMSCLARDPAFRPQSASHVADELARASDVPTESLLATAVTEPLQTRRYESVPGAGIWLLVPAAAVAAVIGVLLGLLDLGGDPRQTREPPPTVAPPARGASPAEEARNLSEWLRRHSR